ncbi:MAG: hypothetical protein GTN40_00660 [Candidatus Aenigmarchaeota archaeon]|nr:hypothetical protein [Candidatus Aenigmarchaeota archaeon]
MEKNYIIVIIAIIVIAFVFLLNNLGTFKDPYSLYYEGDIRHFRANLFEANKTPVYPNEDAIKDVLLNPEVYKIYIAFIPNETENAFYVASSFETTNKLGIVYRHYYKGQTGSFKDVDGSSCMLFFEDEEVRCFKSLPINSTDELIPTPIEPVILLLGPSYANQTSVIVNNNLIILQGRDFSEIDRKYTDLDLAVDKMLLVLMT